MSFVHLHVHDQYSFLDGFGSAEQYAKRAKELGMEAIALTNHGNVDGCIKWQQACKKNGIKSILGVEAYIVPDLATKEKGEKRYHITLLAKDNNGWQNILKMLTYANLDGFYYKPRIDPGLLLEYSNGIIVMGACLASFIYMDGGVELLGKLIYKDVDVALEVMPHLIAGQPEHNKLCASWATEFGIPLVATNDCHYITKEQSDEQEVLLAMQSKAKWNDKNRWKFDVNTLFLTTEKEIRKMFASQGALSDKDIDIAISNTKVIADKCNLFIEKKEVKLPKPPIPGYRGLDEKDQLIQLTLDGFEIRKEKHNWITDSNEQQYLDRIAEELETIMTQGFARYFLIVWELINWCKDPDDGEEPIMCGPGRGCFTGDTKISLLNGTEKSFKELAEEYDREEYFWIYSCLPNGKIIPGKAKGARITKTVDKMCVVEIDNGEKIKCTLDHRFLTTNGKYTEAKDLKAGDSLMPLYREYDPKGYETFYDNNKETFFYTHYMTFIHKQGYIVHHRTFDKRNNAPNDLEQITNKQHGDLHAETNSERWKDPEWRERAIERYWKTLGGIENRMKISERNKTLEFREKVSKGQIRVWEDPEYRSKMANIMAAGINSPEALEKRREMLIKRNKTGKMRDIVTKRNKDPQFIKKVSEGRKRYFKTEKGLEEKEQLGKTARDRFEGRNHKVISVTTISKKQKMYDIEVEKYHNFALSSGVFVHNSVGGSIVAFCLHIIQVDAIKYDLVFSRFISEGRIDLPDIDMDFEDTKRDRILTHLKKLYGEHNVIGLSTFAQMHGRGALRDVARVFNVPLADVNKAAKSIVVRSLGDSRANFSILDAFEAFEDGKAFYEKYPKVSKMAMAMEGQVKGYGRHAAAMCVAADDLRTGTNAHLALRKGTIVANWEKEDAEYMGLMKLDVLGLNALTILNEARKLIKKRHSVDIDYDTLSLDDPAICKEFDAGRGVGIFQFNSPGMMRVCREVRVEDFEELIALNALHRPGPLRSGLITTYRKRKHGEEKVTYIHPFIKKITEKTQGIILYQEQVMMLMYKVGGLPWKTTDMIRKVVSKRKGQEQFLKFKKLFIEGCIKNKTVSAKEGEAIFEELQFFGSYGFVRAHSTEYAMIAYWEMWLKVYYPAEYMTTILTYGSEDKKAEHIREARRLGLKILLPDINASDATRWAIDNDSNLSTPFKEIKGVGEIAATEITKQRADNPYKDIDDLRSRTQKRKVNTRVVTLLDKTHCFDSAQAKLALDDAKLDGLSQYFDFELSNDPIYRYRKMIELLQTCMDIEPISSIEFSGKAIGRMKYHFGKMSILKFGYKEHGDGKSLRDVRGTAGDLGGVYGNFEDGSDFTMLVFGSSFYEENKYAIEHCENEWMLVKAKSTHSDNSVHTSQLWFADDLLKGETEGLKLELLKRPEYNKSYTESMSELSECTSCELREECDGPVIPSVGEANVVLLGEAPGWQENKYGKGFYEKAKSGKLLWDDLREYGLERSMFHITNVCKCFPSNTKTPKKKHIKACKKWLDIEIQAVKPFIILAFGNTSVKLFTDKESGIFNMSGDTEWNDKYKCWICWCAHPASAIYQQENKVFFDRGIENFVNKLNSLGLGG